MGALYTLFAGIALLLTMAFLLMFCTLIAVYWLTWSGGKPAPDAAHPRLMHNKGAARYVSAEEEHTVNGLKVAAFVLAVSAGGAIVSFGAVERLAQRCGVVPKKTQIPN